MYPKWDKFVKLPIPRVALVMYKKQLDEVYYYKLFIMFYKIINKILFLAALAK